MFPSRKPWKSLGIAIGTYINTVVAWTQHEKQVGAIETTCKTCGYNGNVLLFKKLALKHFKLKWSPWKRRCFRHAMEITCLLLIRQDVEISRLLLTSHARWKITKFERKSCGKLVNASVSQLKRDVLNHVGMYVHNYRVREH